LVSSKLVGVARSKAAKNSPPLRNLSRGSLASARSRTSSMPRNAFARPGVRRDGRTGSSVIWRTNTSVVVLPSNGTSPVTSS
jgi:hypothetical protein